MIPPDIATDIVTNFHTNFDTWLHSQVYNNSFLTAGIFTVITSALLYLLRSIPSKIINEMKHRMSFVVVINSENPYYVDINEALNRRAINFLSRSRVMNGKKLTVGYGSSVAFFQGRLCFINRHVLDSQSREFKEQLTITFPLLHKKKLDVIFDRFIKEQKLGQVTTTTIYELQNYGGYSKVKQIPKRVRDSIYIDEVVLSGLEMKLTKFLESREWYAEHGIPYKFGILLYGPPGTGKTSLAKYIASYTDRQIMTAVPTDLPKVARAVFNNDDEDDDPYELNEKKTSDITTKFIVLVEDIDTFDVTQARIETTPVSKTSRAKQVLPEDPTKTLSAILNALDGVNSPEDVIIIATTNHLDKLDPALIRKGRFDEIVHLDNLKDDEIKRMIVNFCGPYDFPNTYTFNPISGAFLQDLILSKNENIEEVIAALEKNNIPQVVAA